MLPTFLVIGGQRCATTWLHSVLVHHPGICLPQDKEPDFLNRLILQQDFVEYRKLFRPPPGETAHAVRGEMSVNYSTLQPPVVQRIARLMPWLRLVFTARDPVDRAWSQAKLVFCMMKQGEGGSPDVSIAQVLRFFESKRALRRGNYLWAIRTWSDAFGADALYVDLYDRVVADPRGYVRDVLTHINADAAWQAPDEAVRRIVHDSQPMPMPDIVRWYLSAQLLAPTRKLNEHLQGRVSHWVERMEQATSATPSRRALRLINRHVLSLPERAAYAFYDAKRTRKLMRKYDDLLANDAAGLRSSSANTPCRAAGSLLPSAFVTAHAMVRDLEHLIGG